MAALHLISIGLIYLVLRNAIYSEIGCPAAVEFINSPLLYQSSSTYGSCIYYQHHSQWQHLYYQRRSSYGAYLVLSASTT